MTQPNPAPDAKIYDVLIDAVKAFPGNARVGNVEAIADSLRINGQYRPIVVRKETQEILAGNHTWKAAKILGWTHIKVTFVENITDEQATRIVLADNRHNDLAEYDEQLLAELLKTLPNLDGTGFDPIYLGDLIAEIDTSLPIGNTVADAVDGTGLGRTVTCPNCSHTWEA